LTMSGASPSAGYATGDCDLQVPVRPSATFKVDSDRETSIVRLPGCGNRALHRRTDGAPGPPAGAARRIQPRPHGVCCSESAGVSNFKKRHGNSQVYQCRNRPGPPAPPRPTPREGGGSVTVPRVTVTNIVCIVRIVRIFGQHLGPLVPGPPWRRPSESDYESDANTGKPVLIVGT
jgi:hypothetical protein